MDEPDSSLNEQRTPITRHSQSSHTEQETSAPPLVSSHQETMDEERGSPLNEQHTPIIPHSQSSYTEQETSAPPLVSSHQEIMDEKRGSPLNEQHTPIISHSQSSYTEQETIALPSHQEIVDEEPSSPLNEQHTPIIPHSQSSYTVQKPTIAPSLISSSPWRLAYVSVASFPALGALGVAFILLLVFISLRRRGTSSRGSNIILTGPPDAGKTAIHSALVFQQVLPTHTTLQANISFIHVPSPEKEKPQIMRLVDVPGHPRIRDQFKEYLPDAKAVVFVVDSSTIARNGAAVAEHLHHVLHALTSSHDPPPLVILAHKCDLVSTSSSTSSDSSNAALAVSRVRTILERELDKRRTSQAGGVGVAQLGENDDSDGALGGLECIGPEAGGFRFKDWEGGNVEILGSFVKVTRDTTEKDNDVLSGLRELGEWLQASQ